MKLEANTKYRIQSVEGDYWAPGCDIHYGIQPWDQDTDDMPVYDKDENLVGWMCPATGTFKSETAIRGQQNENENDGSS